MTFAHKIIMLYPSYVRLKDLWGWISLVWLIPDDSSLTQWPLCGRCIMYAMDVCSPNRLMSKQLQRTGSSTRKLTNRYAVVINMCNQTCIAIGSILKMALQAGRLIAASSKQIFNTTARSVAFICPLFKCSAYAKVFFNCCLMYC